MDEILFYEHTEQPYGVFSNFAITPFIIGGITYQTSEAYYQSQKFIGSEINKEYSDLIASQTTGNKSALLARQTKPYQNYKWAQELWEIIQDYKKKGATIREDWEIVKDNVMRRAVYEKFNQNEKARRILLNTGIKRLVEHTHRDAYWGDGHPQGHPELSGKGLNTLGRILEEVRYLFFLSNRRGYHATSRYPNELGEEWTIPGVMVVTTKDIDFQRVVDLGYRCIFSSLLPNGCNKLKKGDQFIVIGGERKQIKLQESVLTVNYSFLYTDPALSKTEKEENISIVAECIKAAIGHGLKILLDYREENMKNIIEMCMKKIYYEG